MVLRKELLVEIGDFLAKFWSGEDVHYIVDENEIAGSSSVYYREIRVPLPEKLPGDDFTKYRLWRWITWHESMHIRYSPIDYYNRSIKGLISNIIEDYRVNCLGLREFPGMLPETLFYYSYMMFFFDPENHGQMGKVVAFMTRLLAGVVPKGFEEYDNDSVKRAVELVVDELKSRNYHIDVKEMHRLSDEVMKILGLDNLEVEGKKFMKPWTLAPYKNVTKKKMEENVERVFKALDMKVEESRKNSEEARLKEEVLEGSKTVREEFEQIVAKSKRLDIIEKELRGTVKKEREKYESIDSRLYIPRKHAVDASQYYDWPLINHLIAELRRLRRGWVEIRSKVGDEVDVEEVIRKSQKPLIREDRVKVGGLKVMLLLDFSGSISGYEWLYKLSLIAMAEALSEVGCKFAIFAFTKPHYQTEESAVFLIKDFNEKWGVETARRLAQLKASGPTPLNEVYDFLKPYLEKWKPDIFITLTDGMPEDIHGFERKNEAREKVKELKRLTKMVAIAIGHNMRSVLYLSKNLRELDYDRSVAVHNLRDIPKKILWLLGEGA